MSRRLASISFISFKIAASTPRVANFLATASKSVRIRLISNIRTPLYEKAHLTKRWSGRATVPSNFTGVHLIQYCILTKR